MVGVLLVGFEESFCFDNGSCILVGYLVIDGILEALAGFGWVG